MRSPRNLLIAAALLLVVGFGLVYFDSDPINGMSMGPDDSGDGYLSTVSFAFDNAWLVSRQAVFGYALMWLGTLLVAAVVGHRLIAEPSASD